MDQQILIILISINSFFYQVLDYTLNRNSSLLPAYLAFDEIQKKSDKWMHWVRKALDFLSFENYSILIFCFIIIVSCFLNFPEIR